VAGERARFASDGANEIAPREADGFSLLGALATPDGGQNGIESLLLRWRGKWKEDTEGEQSLELGTFVIIFATF
jgi:hypothetical protein